jgi:hypothetical protein
MRACARERNGKIDRFGDEIVCRIECLNDVCARIYSVTMMIGNSASPAFGAHSGTSIHPCQASPYPAGSNQIFSQIRWRSQAILAKLILKPKRWSGAEASRGLSSTTSNGVSGQTPASSSFGAA